MPLQKIFAQLNCTDLERSSAWFEKLFGRSADACPMDGLFEWHHKDNAGFQLVKNAADAGHGAITLIVERLDYERTRLSNEGVKVGNIQNGDVARLLIIADPDENAIVLAEPK